MGVRMQEDWNISASSQHAFVPTEPFGREKDDAIFRVVCRLLRVALATVLVVAYCLFLLQVSCSNVWVVGRVGTAKNVGHKGLNMTRDPIVLQAKLDRRTDRG